jgi:hypothetical protein
VIEIAELHSDDEADIKKQLTWLFTTPRFLRIPRSSPCNLLPHGPKQPESRASTRRVNPSLISAARVSSKCKLD